MRSRFAKPALWLVVLSLLAFPVLADTNPFNLAGGNFSQDWTNTGLITVNNDWSGVPSITGYLGDRAASGTTAGIDPQTILDPLTTVNVTANQTTPNSLTSGGVDEFQATQQAPPDNANPVVAFQGSGTADHPNIIIYLNTIGRTSVNVSYNLRDVDCAADNAIQQVALQYRLGGSGNYTNVPAGFVTDASTGPSLCTAATLVNVALPAAVDNQSILELRIISSNAVGSDEWIGVDDISVTSIAGANNPPTITAPGDPIATVLQDAAPFTVNVSGNDDQGAYIWSATPGTGVSAVTVSGGQSTSTVTYQVTLQAGYSGTASFTATLSDGVNPAVNQAVNISVTPAGGGDAAPIITPPADPITTVAQDAAPFTVGLAGSDDFGIYNWSATPGTGVSSVTVTGGQGTANVTYTVSLQAAFNGTATFTASLSDNVNPAATTPVNITVTAPPPPANHITVSQLYGGGGNSGATFSNDFVELYNPTAASVDLAGWSIQYGSATGTLFSQIQPLGGVIAPGEYFLIQFASGGAVGSALPTPNISGDINLSGTAGKIALVNNGQPLNGNNCGTWLADANLVDFVGYGATANCGEGSSFAPAPSNTTADFRKTNGSLDTDVNSFDFFTATPAPRRTSPIQEIGPAVLSTDPLSNFSNTPRDGSPIVVFTELVDVDPGWFTISCATTGNHDDATSVEAFARNWIIIPNTNFTAGEQCTVTIFKNFVHDRDLDDANPNTDTLPADYSWSFTVATGTAPPYPSSVHLTMGNPSNAVADVNFPNNYLMEKPEIALSYDRDKGTPNWVSWHLSDEWIGSLTRVDTFRPDPAVPQTWYRVLGSDYFASGFDRGHMTPNADRDKETSIPINQGIFLMTNMIPQSPNNNQGPWADMEGYLRTLLPADELYIVSGPAGVGGRGSNGGISTTIDNGHVTVPASTWKVVLVLPKASGDDVARVTAATQTIAVIMPNIQFSDGLNADWHTYITSVDAVEALTGYDFFSNVPDAIENAIEAGINGTNPPGAANGSATTNEDVPKDITLDAANSNANPLTYTIVTPPAHGGLTGSDASRTYTPAPDYNGTDTFTYKVNNGVDSNTATVTVTILEVNDPPIAVDDAKSTGANTTLIFAASDLTANDSTGPANESAQTLLVSSVATTGNTHGSVSLSTGLVTYTPDAGYDGPASFTYQVCDNGVTAGLGDPLCASGLVNVTVTPGATHFSVSAPSNATAGTAFNITVTALDASNNTVTSYSGTVHFTSSDAQAALAADYFFVPADNGSQVFTFTLKTAGAQSITATDTAAASITGSANVSVSPAAAASIDLVSPASATVGNAFGVSVTARDAFGNVAPSYTGTVAFTSNDTQATLPSDYTFTAGDSGVHSFSGLKLRTRGNETLTVTDTGNAFTDSSSITVTGMSGDANGDNTVDPSDIFYLINYLFANGPAPVGIGDANGMNGVEPSDIFYLINYLFAGGPAPVG